MLSSRDKQGLESGTRCAPVFPGLWTCMVAERLVSAGNAHLSVTAAHGGSSMKVTIR